MSNPFSLMFGKVPLENISLPLQKNQISEAFDNEPAVQQIFMISGIRGAGKTVLLTEICNLYRSKENWVVVELNPNGDLLQGLLIKLSNDSRCLNIIKSAKLNLSFWGIGLEIEGSTPITDTETAIMQILTNLQKAGKKVLVAIDEVTSNSKMHEFVSAFQIMLRQNAPLYLLMTGLYENIDELQNEKSLTFLYRAPKIYLKGLNLGAVGRKYKSIFSLNDEQAREMAKCNIDFELLSEEKAVKAKATVKVTGKTGVEMEALHAVTVSLLTIYDMCKALDKRMEIRDVHLDSKSGGKSGDFVR